MLNTFTLNARQYNHMRFAMAVVEIIRVTSPTTLTTELLLTVLSPAEQLAHPFWEGESIALTVSGTDAAKRVSLMINDDDVVL